MSHATDPRAGATPPEVSSRRSFLKDGVAGGAAAFAAGTLLAGTSPARAAHLTPPSLGDIAMLKFLAAAEQIEMDLWQQYCEYATGNRRFRTALQRIDPSLVRYVCDVRDDEESHGRLINRYLISIGEDPVDLSAFKIIPNPKVLGVAQKPRITNLRNLNVDTSWYLRYRSPQNPDFGAEFPQLVELVGRPTVPTSDNLSDLEIQCIAHTAAFHFGFIEQGGASLYGNLTMKAANATVLKTLISIGPVEFYQFAAFHKSLEDLPGLQCGNVTFPDFRNNPNLSWAIMPEPCEFLEPGFPRCSVLRPVEDPNAGPVAIATALVRSGLFRGQSPSFFRAVNQLAGAAQQAERGF